jgi:DNA-binding NarL/FixJ family response regulator
MTSEIRVPIVDDSEGVRRSLRELLPLSAAVEVVGEREDGRLRWGQTGSW